MLGAEFVCVLDIDPCHHPVLPSQFVILHPSPLHHTKDAIDYIQGYVVYIIYALHTVPSYSVVYAQKTIMILHYKVLSRLSTYLLLRATLHATMPCVMRNTSALS